jgi:hypothetical protein
VALFAVTYQFGPKHQIGAREGFNFFLGWYRVVLGVQFKDTSVVVRGF